MSKVSIYLNFMGKTEEAFTFYKRVFESEFTAPVQYMKDIPADPEQPALPENEQDMVMHVALPILGGLQLMGTDELESRGRKVIFGNNVYINLEPDTRAETDELFNALSEDGKVEMPLQEMFWGDYFGSLKDKFGVCWMFNCSSKE